MDRVFWKCYKCIGGIDGAPRRNDIVSYFVTVKGLPKYHRLHISYDTKSHSFCQSGDWKTLLDLDCGEAIMGFLEADADPETEGK